MRLFQAILSAVMGVGGLGACQAADPALLVPAGLVVPVDGNAAGPDAFASAGGTVRPKAQASPISSPYPSPIPMASSTPPGSASATATPGPSPTSSVDAVETEIVRLTNAYRAQNGMPPLTATSGLMRFARSRSQDMAMRGYFAHTTPDGLSVFDLLRQAGIPFGAARENIGWNKGYPAEGVATAAIEGWIASSGHRRNLLAADVTKLGVGSVQAADGAWYLTQVFTN